MGWLLFLRSVLWNATYSFWGGAGGYGAIAIAVLLLLLVPMYWLNFRRSYVFGSAVAAGSLLFWTILALKFGFQFTDYITMGFLLGSLVISLKYYKVAITKVGGKGPLDLPVFG